MSNSVFRGLKRLLIRILIVQFLLGFLPQGFAHLDGITNSTAATSIKHSTNVSSDTLRGEQVARHFKNESGSPSGTKVRRSCRPVSPFTHSASAGLGSHLQILH